MRQFRRTSVLALRALSLVVLVHIVDDGLRNKRFNGSNTLSFSRQTRGYTRGEIVHYAIPNVRGAYATNIQSMYIPRLRQFRFQTAAN